MMEQRRVTGVDEDGNVSTKVASFFVCGECQADVFFIFQIDGQDHVHLQCGQCGVSFCPSGKCQETNT